jgi:hypothetical protein
MADRDDEIALERFLDNLPGLEDGTLAQKFARLEGRPVDPDEIKVVFRCIFDALTPESQRKWLERNSPERGEFAFDPPPPAPPASKSEPDWTLFRSDLANIVEAINDLNARLSVLEKELQ